MGTTMFAIFTYAHICIGYFFSNLKCRKICLLQSVPLEGTRWDMCAGYYTLAIYLTVVKWYYIIIYHHHWPAQDQHGCHWSAWCSNHCNLRKGSAWKEIVCALTQVAMIAASCTSMVSVLIMSWSVVVVVRIACCCCILLHCTDAGPDLCTLHPDLWHKHSTCAGGGIIIIVYSVLMYFITVLLPIWIHYTG